jgi:uncharacterized protein (TIGR02246 family)
MRRSVISPLAFIVLSAAACAPPAPPPVDLAAEEQAVRAISMQWLEFENANDMAAIAALFAEDGTLIREDEEPIVGAGAIEAHMTADQAANPGAVSSWTTDRVEVGSAGDLAVEYGTWSETGLGPDGSGEDHGRYVTIYRKVNGAWKVAADASLSTKSEEVGAAPTT